MKSINYFFAFVFFVSFVACKNNGKSIQEGTPQTTADLINNPVTSDAPIDSVNVAKMVFAEKTFNFGTAKEGDKITHTFKFKNEGKVPLLIRDAHSTCGCTVPEFPKDPIPVGGIGEINVTFNTAHKEGAQKKPIIISANTFPVEDTYVTIEGEVTKTK